MAKLRINRRQDVHAARIIALVTVLDVETGGLSPVFDGQRERRSAAFCAGLETARPVGTSERP